MAVYDALTHRRQRNATIGAEKWKELESEGKTLLKDKNRFDAVREAIDKRFSEVE